MPQEVDDVHDAIMKDNPEMEESKAWAIAWDKYKKSKGENMTKEIIDNNGMRQEIITGPGGHVPDGTGPYGRGAGPGEGKGDGTGLKKKATEQDATPGFDMSKCISKMKGKVDDAPAFCRWCFDQGLKKYGESKRFETNDESISEMIDYSNHIEYVAPEHLTEEMNVVGKASDGRLKVRTDKEDVDESGIEIPPEPIEKPKTIPEGVVIGSKEIGGFNIEQINKEIEMTEKSFNEELNYDNKENINDELDILNKWKDYLNDKPEETVDPIVPDSKVLKEPKDFLHMNDDELKEWIERTTERIKEAEDNSDGETMKMLEKGLDKATNIQNARSGIEEPVVAEEGGPGSGKRKGVSKAPKYPEEEEERDIKAPPGKIYFDKEETLYHTLMRKCESWNKEDSNASLRAIEEELDLYQTRLERDEENKHLQKMVNYFKREYNKAVSLHYQGLKGKFDEVEDDIMEEDMSLSEQGQLPPGAKSVKSPADVPKGWQVVKGPRGGAYAVPPAKAPGADGTEPKPKEEPSGEPTKKKNPIQEVGWEDDVEMIADLTASSSPIPPEIGNDYGDYIIKIIDAQGDYEDMELTDFNMSRDPMKTGIIFDFENHAGEKEQITMDADGGLTDQNGKKLTNEKGESIFVNMKDIYPEEEPSGDMNLKPEDVSTQDFIDRLPIDDLALSLGISPKLSEDDKRLQASDKIDSLDEEGKKKLLQYHGMIEESLHIEIIDHNGYREQVIRK